MADREAIANVLATWALGYDARIPDLMERCFTENASMTLVIGENQVMGPYVGRPEVMKHFLDHHETQTDQRRHVVTNLLIVEESEASARTASYLSLMVTEDNSVRLQATGVYRDRFVRVDGQWRIEERHLTLDAHY